MIKERHGRSLVDAAHTVLLIIIMRALSHLSNYRDAAFSEVMLDKIIVRQCWPQVVDWKVCSREIERERERETDRIGTPIFSYERKKSVTMIEMREGIIKFAPGCGHHLIREKRGGIFFSLLLNFLFRIICGLPRKSKKTD